MRLLPRFSKASSQRILFAVLTVLLLAVFGFQLVYHALRTSATEDERPHILAGYRYWQCGDFTVNPEHPPLVKLLATIPLTRMELIGPNWECGSRVTTARESWSAGTSLLIKNGIDRVVIPSRLMASLMSLLLAILLFLAAFEMFGPMEALVSLVLLVFEPNLIAHGSLVTTDMGVTTGMFAAIYAYYRFQNKHSLLRFVVLGCAVGLALTTKHTGVLIIPILAVLSIGETLFRKSGTGSILPLPLRNVGTLAAVAIIGIVLLWATYGFRYSALPNVNGKAFSTDELLLGANNAPPEAVNWTRVKAVRLIDQLGLLPEAYSLGLIYVVASGSRTMVLFDKLYPTGRWFYFPVAFVIKTSLALLVLLPCGLLAFGLYRQHSREVLYMLIPALLFFAVALTSQMNIGIRHILPVYPLLILVAASGACVLARRFMAAKYLLIALLIFHFVAASRTAPNYIAFANDFWGGTEKTHRYFTDSNVEWGQNSKLVNQYVRDNNITDCWYIPYGSAGVAIATQPCRIVPGISSWDGVEDRIETIPPAIEGTFFVSSFGVSPRAGETFAVFRGVEPVDMIGGSILVFKGHFEVPLAAALGHDAVAQQLLAQNRIDAALSKAREAVSLAASDPRPHFTLALVLKTSGQTLEARREFEKIVELTELDPSTWQRIRNRAEKELEKLSK